jgi:hypothetical protein
MPKTTSKTIALWDVRAMTKRKSACVSDWYAKEERGD